MEAKQEHVERRGFVIDAAKLQGQFYECRAAQLSVADVKKLTDRIENQAGRLVDYQEETRLLKKLVAGLEHEVSGWIESARHFSAGQDFYQGIVRRCGVALGPAAYTSDDGSVQDDVLALRVPELVEELVRPQNRFQRALHMLITGK